MIINTLSFIYPLLLPDSRVIHIIGGNKIMSNHQNDVYYENLREMEDERLAKMKVIKKLIREDYVTPHQMKTWESLGFFIERVEPLQVNFKGYLVKIYVKEVQ